MQTNSTRAGNQDAPPREPQKPSTFGDIARSIGSRNLMIIIVTMPLVFLAVVAGIISVFGGDDDDAAIVSPAAVPVIAERLAEPAPLAAQANGATAAAAIAANPSAIGLPAGSDVTAMSLDGDRLALRVDGPQGGFIVIYDLSAGAVVQRIAVTRTHSN